MAHHNRSDCTTWPCNPAPSAGHHAPPAERDDEDDGTTSEARAEVQPPRRKDTDSQ